ncbi:PadR family transcriptional regulator [Miniphocaeibacter massiliensis]|uniref:PadR family transcriptional regulator n=1 Tax=Miniphocaeibacter massiliensis TaxID=2041841 RepID=UPI000C1C08E5|nr:PadR family transcriptional regulator [Miniphocaeibacter massiliensis]
MVPSQMLKGVLEECVLEIISRDDLYGYLIVEELKGYGFEDIVEGTIYPILLRLEKKSLIVADYRESEVGPRRKYYKITPEGLKQLKVFYENWEELSVIVDKIINNKK